jgi:hypothetical protein
MKLLGRPMRLGRYGTQDARRVGSPLGGVGWHRPEEEVQLVVVLQFLWVELDLQLPFPVEVDMHRWRCFRFSFQLWSMVDGRWSGASCFALWDDACGCGWGRRVRRKLRNCDPDLVGSALERERGRSGDCVWALNYRNYTPRVI